MRGDAKAAAAPRGCQPEGTAQPWLARLLRQFQEPKGFLGHVAGWIMASRGSNRERSSWSIEQLQVKAGDRVLEIGFGPGVALRRLSELAAPGTVVGLDHSAAMQRQAARRNAAGMRSGRVRLERAEVERLAELPGLAGPFDKVLSVNCFQFWRDPGARLREIRARMAPGGRIALTVQPRHRGASNADAQARGLEMARLLEEAGFTDVGRQTLPLRPVAAVCATATNP